MGFRGVPAMPWEVDIMPDRNCPFTYDDATDWPGSRWVLANFHTHTPASSDYLRTQDPARQRSLTPDEMAAAILDDCVVQGIRVLAITDHNTPSFVRAKRGAETVVVPEAGSYYAAMRRLVADPPEGKAYSSVLVLPGVEIGAENIHVLGVFPPTPDPEFDAMHIAAILEEGNCLPTSYGDATASCTEFSVADAIDVVHERGGIAIPAHIDGPSGFLTEVSQARMLALILSRPHLFAVEYVNDACRVRMATLLTTGGDHSVLAGRAGNPIAWTKSSDSHFTLARNASADGNGEPLGTSGRRTWLRLDPSDLTFESVRAALRDPDNRVRVDSTARTFGRQGSLPAPSTDRTYVRAMRVTWSDKSKDSFRVARGTSVLVGPPGAGKRARLEAISVASGVRPTMQGLDATLGGASPSDAESVDLLLSRGSEPGADLWWLRRTARKPGQVSVAALQVDNAARQVVASPPTDVTVGAGGSFDHRAVRRFLEAQAMVAPRAFDVTDMDRMLADRARTGRFVEWHYTPEADRAAHRQLHADLWDFLLRPMPDETDDSLARGLQGLLASLQDYRTAAVAALNAFYKDRTPGLTPKLATGTWRKAGALTAARAIRKLGSTRTEDAVWSELLKVEDGVSLSLRLAGDPAISDATRAALTGILLVLPASGVGPVILGGPEQHFEPEELAEQLAPAIQDAVEAGAQFIISVADKVFPFAVDADLLLVCERDRATGGVGGINSARSGGLDRQATAEWALRALDGGSDLVARRQALYADVIGQERAVRQAARLAALAALAPKPRKPDTKGKRRTARAPVTPESR